MGRFINAGNSFLRKDRNLPVYVDKSMLISYTNSLIDTSSNCICVSRPRRFGKTMAANMIAAYYDESCNSRDLFSGLKIEEDHSFSSHLNRYPVVFIDAGGFFASLPEKKEMVQKLNDAIVCELSEQYPEAITEAENTIQLAISKINERTGKSFVFVIDEWDALFREYKDSISEQKAFLDLLRSLFKNRASGQSIALCYMTGILPIKKYNTQSALNNFTEFTMLDPLSLAPFVGFNEEEVEILCKKHDMDFNQMKRWYDGYSFSDIHSVYSPFSVVSSITFHKFKNYWTSTSSFDDAKQYINMDFDGLKDSITKMISGERCYVNVRSFENDFVTLHDKNQVMTLLIHLGYLAYDEATSQAYIPNLEVSQRLSDSIISSNWGFASSALSVSQNLLQSTWDGNEAAVARINNR